MARLTADRKDYLCQNDEKFRSNKNEISNTHSLNDEILCDCGVKSAPHAPMNRKGKFKMNSCEWSQLGPMGYLVEPKLYPTSVWSTSAIPKESCIKSRNGHRTISDKCDLPLNTEPISPLPLPDILRRINEDRLRSTYQIDFGHMDDYSWADYNDLMLTVGYKSARQLEQPKEEIKCRERPRPPHLNGHEIPGRPSKDSSIFAFGNGQSKTKRHSGPQVTNRPLRPVRPRRMSLQSRDVINDDDDVVGISKGVFDDHQNERKPILGKETSDEESRTTKNANGDETSRIFGSQTGDKKGKMMENATSGGRKQISGMMLRDNVKREFSIAAGDKSRQTSGDITSMVRGSINSKRMSNGRRNSIDMPSLKTERNSLIKRDDKEVRKIQRDSRDSRNSRNSRNSQKSVSHSEKVKENFDEYELLPSMPWASEYQDIISRTADDILRSKLHYYGKIRLVTPNPDCL